MNRRNFVKASALGAAAGISVIPSRTMGKPLGHVAPSDKVNLACIGIGNRGGEITRSLHATGLATIVAFCDVDMGSPDAGRIEIISGCTALSGFPGDIRQDGQEDRRRECKYS